MCFSFLSNYSSVALFLLLVLRVEPRVVCMLGHPSTFEPHLASASQRLYNEPTHRPLGKRQSLPERWLGAVKAAQTMAEEAGVAACPQS